METVLLDIRQALRALLRAPGYTLTAILSLGLGIGANTAIYTVYRSALLEPLPVARPDELVRLRTQREENINENFSYPHFDALRTSGVFRDVFAHAPAALALRTGNTTEQLAGVAVSSNYFDVLGVPIQRGRVFGEQEAGAAQSIILSDVLWRRTFAQRDNVIGEVVQLNGQPFTVIGVAPASFAGLTRGGREEFWISLAGNAALTGADIRQDRRRSWLNVVGRMRSNATIETTQDRLQAFDASLRADQLIGETHRNLIVPAARGLSFSVSELETPLRYLMAAVGLVLLIACANVASLLLARTAARQKDLAVRLAIGGSRRRLLRQLMTESLTLSMGAGAVGLLLATWLTDVLAAYRPAMGERLVLDTSPDAAVLGFTFVISLATGLVFGLGPALFSAPRDLMPLLKDTAGRVTARMGARGVLVSTQVALSLTLLVGALMLSRTMQRLNDVELGFSTRNALLASFDLDAGGYTRERGAPVVHQLLQRLRALPGVLDASAATTINPSPGGSRYDGIALEGAAVPADQVGFDLNLVDERYFATMGMPIVSGRGFSAADQLNSSSVAIINEEMARRFWPDQDPIGRRMVVDSARNIVWQIVGIARDGKYRGLRESPETNVWRPLAQQQPRNFLTLIIHTRGQPLQVAESIRSELRTLDPAIPLFDVRTLEQHIALATSQERMATQLAIAFSVLSLALSALGLYGLLAFTVAQQTREIGVRMALGAPRTLVLQQVMSRGLRLVGIGLLLGVPAAMAASKLLASLLYGITSTDAFSFVAGALVLLAAGACATLLPARRAVRVDPVIALRAE